MASSFIKYKFVDEVSEDLVCSICTNVLREPVQIECCGQLFCEECLQRWIQTQKACPFCWDIQLKYIKDRRMKRMIDNCRIYCSNRSKGCEAISILSERYVHREACLFVEVPCTNGCGVSILKKELQNHKAKQCPRRNLTCQYCNGLYEYIKIKDHMDECTSFPLDCPKKCGHAKIQRKDLLDHIKECPLELVKCSFVEVGCEQEIPRKKMAAHKRSNTEYHLELMLLNTTSQLQQLSLNFVGLASCVTNQLATIETNPQNSVPITNIRTALETMTTLLEQGKQYCLPLVKRDGSCIQSPSFYIQPGYKMNVSINDFKQCTISLEKSEHDDKLEWPVPPMDIELTTMNKQVLNRITTCSRCASAVTRVVEGEKTEKEIQIQGQYDWIPFHQSDDWIPFHQSVDPILIAIKIHICQKCIPSPIV